MNLDYARARVQERQDVMKPEESPWRPAYEAIAAMAWMLSSFLMVYQGNRGGLAWSFYLGPALLFLLIALWMGCRALKLWAFKACMNRFELAFIRIAQIRWHRRHHPGNVFLGYGFDWQPRHTCCALEILKRDVSSLMPPGWYRLARRLCARIQDFFRFHLAGRRLNGHQGRVLEARPEAKPVGKPWIQGLEPCENPVYVPEKTFEGHTLILGTTGSGKTRLIELLLFQSILRGDVIYIIDPKGDHELRESARHACEQCARPDAFVLFHPAFPERSIRIDPLKNWTRVTQIASRLASLLPASSEVGDPFAGFAWEVLNSIVGGCVYVSERPTLVRLRLYVINGPDSLMKRVLEVFFERTLPHWKSVLWPYIEKAKQSTKPSRGREGGNRNGELAAYMDYYRHEVADSQKSSEVSALMSLTEHNREHLGKMLTLLVPILSQLTTNPLDALLSPDVLDIEDERPVFDTWKLINGGHVVYIGLDSLSDKTVGSAIGSLLLADLASVAGAIYNYGDPAVPGGLDKPRTSPGIRPRIKVFIDEAAECINNPLIQLLNKGRGAGFELDLAMQTLADLSAALGSEDRARMVLGNCNSMVALRTRDGKTQKYIVENFGETAVPDRSYSQSRSSSFQDFGLDSRSQDSMTVRDVRTELVPPFLLGELPDMHYLASFAGGRIVKGRVPIVSGKRFAS
ncbi:MAG: conjugative transfer system coupling protein TraD [Pseudomonadota bacterium]|nr:conjugative transfer system coupling protein TraD [Pseudomonadota bacterium]